MTLLALPLGLIVFVLVLYTLALMRIVRLINADTILDPLRARLADYERNALIGEIEAKTAGQKVRAAALKTKRLRWHTVNYFISCPWCVSIWTAALTTWVPMYFPTNALFWYVAVVLAASHLVGVFARFTDAAPPDIEHEDDDDAR